MGKNTQDKDKQTKQIGLLINDAYSDYEIELTNGALKCCNDNGYSLLVFSVDELKATYFPYSYQKRSIASFATKNNIDGLILASAVLGNFVPKEELFAYLKNYFDLPKVSAGLAVPGIPSIIVDPKEGFKKLIEDLVVNHGCKKFCLIGVMKGNIDGQERKQIFLDVLKEHNLSFDEKNELSGTFTYDSAKIAIEKYVAQNGKFEFDAVVSLNDDMAFACIDYCQANNIKIPEDIKIVGFDDNIRSSYETPRLSSVNQRIGHQGYLACSTLIDMLGGIDVPLIQTVSTEPRFRQTCGCVPMNNTSIKYLDSDKNEVLFDEEVGNQKMSEWLFKKPQVVKLNYLNSSLQKKMDTESLRQEFVNSMKMFDVHAGALVLYESPISMTEPFLKFPIPEKAILVSAFDDYRNFNLLTEGKTITFNPQKNILPDNILSKTKHRIYIYPITDWDLQFGYLIYTFGSYDEVVYTMMNSIFSKIISNTYDSFKKDQLNKELEERNKSLNKLSTTDELTSLLNRRGFTTLGQQTINIALQLHRTGLVVFGDMDGLKYINDTYGHDAGDKAIIAEAEILRTSFRNSDIIGRLGGDEFAIVASGLSVETFKRIHEKIYSKCNEYNATSGQPFTLSISLGYAEFSYESYNLFEILNQADILLYEEKKNKKNTRS